MMGCVRSRRRERVSPTPKPADSAPDSDTADEAEPDARKRRWPGLLALLLLLGVVVSLRGDLRIRPAGGADGPTPPSSPAASSSTARVLLTGDSDLEVSVRAWLGREPLVELDDGSLPQSIEIPRGEEVLLLVEAPGRARFVRRVRVTEDQQLAVPLEPGATVRGVVVDDRGEPVSSALVRVERESESLPPWLARTDSEGRFEIDTLYAGEHRLRVSSSGHGAIGRSGVEPGGTELRIVLERVGSVAGRVTGPEGRPAAGATVLIAGSGIWPARQTQTDDEGRFRWVDVPSGVYEVRAHSGELVAEPRRGLDVEPDTRAFLNFTLQPGLSLRGTIRDTDTGEPVEGAQITASAEALDAAPRAAVSDEEGHFSIQGLRPGVHRVSVFATGYIPVNALEHSPPAALEIGLVPGGTLMGVVLDQDRQPVEGATIEVLGETASHQPVALSGQGGFRSAVFASQLAPIGPDPGGGMALPVTEGPVPPIPVGPAPTAELDFAPLPVAPAESGVAAQYLTDSEGGFRIAGIPPGHVQVVARHPSYAPATTARLYVAAGATRDDLELILAPAGRLAGRVVDEREEGVEGVLVEVRSDREPHPRIAFTAERGAFAVESVVGELTVTALPNGRPATRARITVEPAGAEDITLRLEGELYSLRGRTVDELGFPVANVQIAVTTLRADAPHRGTLFSEADGTFVASSLPAGPWHLEATASGRAPSRVDVFDTDEEVQVALQPGAALSGAVLDEYSGEPVRALVSITQGELPPERLTARVRSDGRFEIPRARAATWRLLIEADGYLPYDREVTIEDRGRGPQALALDPIRLTPGGRIEGTVVDALSRPVARATVVAGDQSARTGTEGHFVLAGLAEGEVELVASHPAAGESPAEAVRVLAARETLGIVLHLSERFDPDQAQARSGRRRGVALHLSWREGLARVRAVIEGSRAERAGLREGDILTVIDGETPSSLREARRLLRGAPGIGAVLGVRRGDREVLLHVEREVWFPD